MVKKIKWENWNKMSNNFSKYKNIKSNLIYGKYSKEKPDVSIMILTYKRAEGLKKSLDSALNQSFSGTYEIVVCDDSGFDESTDKLMKKYCSKYKNIIYYRHEKNLGQYPNWNRACELCRTEWYCLLHDDDILTADYLETLYKASKKHLDAGLIGSYFDVVDSTKKVQNNKRLIDRLVDLFIDLNNGKMIPISLNDNNNHIFVLSCCLFINKNKALEIGGLNNEYYPSSDFFFSAKMNTKYQTYFLPMKLSIRGVGENVSLKQETCDESIKCAYHLSYEISKYLNFSEKKCKKKASIGAVIAEIGVRGYNDVDYGKIKEELGMKKIYNNKLLVFIVNIISKVNWGLLLFRRSK